MDSLLLKSGTVQGKSALLALVCDGVGSMADGGFASGEATRMLSEWFAWAGAAQGTDQNATVQIGADNRIGLGMRDAVLRINAFIIARAKESKMDTATTLSALLLTGSTYYIVHIGVSRIYCWDSRMDSRFGSSHAPGQALSLLTHDDVSASGKLTACIGQTEDIFPHYVEGDAEGKTFLLCSDGLYKRMDTQVLLTQMQGWNIKTLQEPAETLTRYVIDRGEQDNISVALAVWQD